MTVPTSNQTSHTHQYDFNPGLFNPELGKKSYQTIFSENERNQIKDYAKASELIYYYRNNQSVFDQFNADRGYKLQAVNNPHIVPFSESYRRKLEEFQQQWRDKQLELLSNPHLRERVVEELEELAVKMHKQEAEANQGYLGVALINHKTKSILVINKGTDSYHDQITNLNMVVLNFTDTYGHQAIKFAKDQKEIADRLNYRIDFTGHSLGGYLAHLQKAVVDGEKVISFDNPFLTSDIVEKYLDNDFNISQFGDENVITILSNPNLVNGGLNRQQYGIVCRCDVNEKNEWGLFQNGKIVDFNLEAHRLDDICKQIEMDAVHIERLVPGYRPKPEVKKDLDEIIKIANDFNEQCGEIKISIEGISHQISEGDLSQADLLKIEKDLLESDKLIGKLETAKQTATELNAEIDKVKVKEEFKAKYFASAARFVEETSAKLYLYNQQKLQQEREKYQLRAIDDQASRHQKYVEQQFQFDYNCMLPAITSNVRYLFNEHQCIGNRLNDIDHFLKTYKSQRGEIQNLIDQRKKAILDYGAQHEKVVSLGKAITQKFNRFSKNNQKAVAHLGKLQMGLGIAGSFFNIASGVLPAPFNYVATGVGSLFNAGSNAVGIGIAHHQKRLMKEQDRYQNKLGQLQDLNGHLAQQRVQANVEIRGFYDVEAQWRKEYTNQMKHLILLDPRVYRGILQENIDKVNARRGEISEKKTKNHFEIQNARSFIDDFNKKYDPYNNTQIEMQNVYKQMNEKVLEAIKNDKPTNYYYEKGYQIEYEFIDDKKKRDIKIETNLSEKKIIVRINTHGIKWDPNKKNPTVQELGKRFLGLNLQTTQLPKPSDDDRNKRSEAESQITKLELENGNLDYDDSELQKEIGVYETELKAEDEIKEQNDQLYDLLIESTGKPEINRLQEKINGYIREFHERYGPERQICNEGIHEIEKFFSQLMNGPIMNLLLKIIPVSDKTKQSIGRTPLILQNFARLGRELYQVFDALRTIDYANHQLGIIAKQPAQPFAIGNIELSFRKMSLIDLLKDYLPENSPIKLLGIENFFNSKVLPYLRIFNGALTCINLISYIFKGCPAILSREETKLIEIENTLRVFQEHLDVRIDNIHRHLENFQEEIQKDIEIKHEKIIQILNDLSVEIDQSENEIIKEMTLFKKDIIDKIDNNEYVKLTSEIEKKGSKIKKMVISENSKPAHQLKFFEKIRFGIENETSLSANTGVLIGISPNNIHPTVKLNVNIKDIGNHTHYYSCAILSQIGETKMISLFLFNELYKKFLEGREAVMNCLANPEDPVCKKIKECEVLFENKRKELQKQFSQVQNLIIECRNNQIEFIKKLQTKVAKTREIKSSYLEDCIKKTCDKDLYLLFKDQKEFTVKRFDYADLFRKKTLKGSYKWVKRPDPSVTYTVLRVATLGLFGSGDDYYHGIKMDYRRRFSKYSILSHLRHVPFDGYYDIKIRVWVTAKGLLSSQMITGKSESVEYDRPLEEYSQSKGKTLFDMTYNYKNRKVINNPSIIKCKEIESIDPKVHLLDSQKKKEYSGYVHRLMYDYWKFFKNYSNWIELLKEHPIGATEIRKRWIKVEDKQWKEKYVDNIFLPIVNESEFVLSTDDSLVKLAFPKSLLRELESHIDENAYMLEASGKGFLSPLYSFSKNMHTGVYELKIGYYFTDLHQQQNERQMYYQFTVAKIDEQTVKSFANPIYHDSHEFKNCEIDLNMFLVQAMYTNFVDKLGLPGHQTVTLGQGKFVVPAELPFPGFYHLLKHYPSRCIDFNSKSFNDELSRSAMIGANGGLINARAQAAKKYAQKLDQMMQPNQAVRGPFTMNISRIIREEKKKYLKDCEKLSDQTRVLGLYCRLISCLDDFSLWTMLEDDFGIFRPDDLGILYDAVMNGIQLPLLKQSNLDKFERILTTHLPSEHMSFVFQTKLNETKNVRTIPLPTPSANRRGGPIPQPHVNAQAPKSVASSSYQANDDIDIGNASKKRGDKSYKYEEKDIIHILSHYLLDETEVTLFTTPLPRAQISPPENDGLGQLLSQLKGKLSKEKLLLCAYNPGAAKEGHWVALGMILTDDGKLKLYYKDSLGTNGDPNLNTRISTMTGYEVEEINTQVIKEQTDGTSCGIFAIKNLLIMANKFKEDKAKFDDWFQKGVFCTQKEVGTLRKVDFAVAYDAEVQKGKEAEDAEQTRRKDFKVNLQPDVESLIEKLKSLLLQRNHERYEGVTFESSSVEGKVEKMIGMEIDCGQLKGDGAYEYTFAIRSSKDFDIQLLKEDLVNLEIDHTFEDNKVIRIKPDEASILINS